MYASIILLPLQHSEAIKSPRLVRLQLMFVAVIAFRIACFEDFSWFLKWRLCRKLIKLIKKRLFDSRVLEVHILTLRGFFLRQLLSSCIYISVCLLRCETPLFPAPPADRGEAGELRSAGNKCNTVIMGNGQQWSRDRTVQLHAVWLVASSSLMWTALSLRGIVSGFAAPI